MKELVENAGGWGKETREKKDDHRQGGENEYTKWRGVRSMLLYESLLVFSRGNFTFNFY